MKLVILSIIGLLEITPLFETDFIEHNNAVGRLHNKVLNQLCTAVFISNDLVLTANHCVFEDRYAKGLIVETGKDVFHCEEIIYSDAFSDIATLRCDESNDSFIPQANTVPEIGDDVHIVFQMTKHGDHLNYLSSGKVVNINDYQLNYDADTVPGASGAPILNSDGHLVGIHTSTKHGIYNIGTRLIRD